MPLRPLHDRVLIKRIQETKQTEGGLFIPDSAQDKPLEGEVIAVGDGIRYEDGALRNFSVKPGDRVVFGNYMDEVTADGEKYILLRECDIICVRT